MKKKSNKERTRLNRLIARLQASGCEETNHTPAPATKPEDSTGRKSQGLYPHISRTKLAEILGYDITTVAGILQGRTRVTLEVAVMMAEAIGVSVAQLNRDLLEAQTKFRKRKFSSKGNYEG